MNDPSQLTSSTTKPIINTAVIDAVDCEQQQQQQQQLAHEQTDHFRYITAHCSLITTSCSRLFTALQLN